MNYHDFAVTRNQAAALLRISERTLDRYIKNQKLQSHVDKGRVLLSEAEIKDLTKNIHQGFKSTKRIETYPAAKTAPLIRPHRTLKKTSEKAQTSDRVRLDNLDTIDKADTRQSENNLENVFKKLYDHTMSKLDDAQKRLEGANYRVGQLEAKMEMYGNHFISLAEYQKELRLLKSQELETNSKYYETRLTNTDLELKVKEERFNKQVIGTVLFAALILQPLIVWMFDIL